MNQCLNCHNKLQTGKTFCSISCSGNYTEKKSIEKWLNGKLPGHTGKTNKVKPFVRAYLFRKYKFKCSKCGWGILHPDSNMPPLEVNHIDGNSENTIESNLELLCPNCHSLTKNFRNRNKGNGRKFRRIGAA